MGRNKYRPALRWERWEQGRTVGQRFVSHRDRPRDRVKTDGQDMYRQRKRFKTGGHGMETDRRTDRGRRFLWRRLMGVCNARSHWHWCRQNCAEVGSTGEGVQGREMMVSTLTSPLWEAAAAGESDTSPPCQRHQSTLKYCSFDII